MPDKALMIDKTTQFRDYMKRLSAASGMEITDLESLIQALQNQGRLFCCASGQYCRSWSVCFTCGLSAERCGEKKEFASFLKSSDAVYSNPDAFAGYVLTALSKMYHEKGWVQQFHLGAIRNNNQGMFMKLGADTGYDSIGDFKQIERMSACFGNLSTTDQLTKTIVYNLNPFG